MSTVSFFISVPVTNQDTDIANNNVKIFVMQTSTVVASQHFWHELYFSYGRTTGILIIDYKEKQRTEVFTNKADSL